MEISRFPKMTTATAQAPGANAVQDQNTNPATAGTRKRRNAGAGRIAAAAVMPGATLAAGNNAAGTAGTVDAKASPKLAQLQKQDEVARLQQLLGEAQSKLAAMPEAPVKVAYTDAQIATACQACVEATRKSPGQPQRSLAKVLGNAPLLTDSQRETWKAAKAKIEEMHDAWARETAPKILGFVKAQLRAKKGASQIAGRYSIPSRGPNKNKVVSASIRAKKIFPKRDEGKPDLGKARSGV